VKLHATKVLAAVIDAGFVPKQFTQVGPFDEGTAIGSAGPTSHKVAKPGANRVLACEFEPLGERCGLEAAQSINEVVAQLRATVVHLEERELESVPVCVADLRFLQRRGDSALDPDRGVAVEGMVYRFVLTAVESKSEEMRSALLDMVGVVSGLG
jgi:hypothetical protein